ncbi:flagellar capping protein [Caulobacter sp. AP07]|uniref:flagellar filament capping protein FliD n=1 Tax=Caulobacter sp. AP07 TaxID=1144304 RepID=UPI0002721103|nr:flagellar filament capping protein FliD [Caulobacter sp. AP07]EJL34809.1 flagellar capping protein [Caulobacter sp. AP07]
MTTTSAVSTSGSTSHVTGTISGLDTDALIEAAVAQKTARADTIDVKVTANQAKVAAYQTLQTLLQAVSDSMSSLAAAAYSSVSTTTNAFDEKQAYLTASDGSDATDILAISADSDAIAAAYDISVTQLAKAMKVASAAQGATAALGLDGVMSLSASGGTAVEITVTADMTLGGLASAINAQATASGVTATVITGAAGAQLVLSTSGANQQVTLSTVSGDDIGLGVGLTDAGGAFASVLQAAQPSIVVIDGLTVQGDSNELTDVVPGLSISLLQATTAGQSVTLDIEANYDDIKTSITDFVSAYNALRAFVTTNQTVGSDGAVADDAVLFADSILRDAGRQLNAVLSGAPSSAGDEVANLADLGISFDADNQLVLSSETTLDNLLLTDLASVASFFETRFTADNANLKLLKNATALSFDFALDVTAVDGTIAGVSVNGDSSLFTVSGSLITGAKGTIYEGLSFALASATSGTIAVKIDQGFANRITSLLNGFANTTSGVIQTQIASLEDIDASLTTKADEIRGDAEDYRARLVARYAAMETELYAAQTLQSQIEAILGASSDDDS